MKLSYSISIYSWHRTLIILQHINVFMQLSICSIPQGIILQSFLIFINIILSPLDQIRFQIIMFKQIALATNWLLTLAFSLYFPTYSFVLLSPILHTLAAITIPQCYVRHCHPSANYEMCHQCGLQQWIRMHHCYRCGVCIHKYDHHCVLLDICVGEANQKYYFLMLWGHLGSSITQAYQYLHQAGKYLWMDENGYQHMETTYIIMALLIIFYCFNVIIVGYLSVYHTRLILLNETTYEVKKRQKIKYIPVNIGADQHVFDKGICENLRSVFLARSEHPIQWQMPERKGNESDKKC